MDQDGGPDDQEECEDGCHGGEKRHSLIVPGWSFVYQ